MSNYIFPFHMITKGTKVILYGAGKVGTLFYKQLQVTSYATVVLWVDINYEKIKKNNEAVRPITDIEKVQEFDCVLIAIDNEEIAQSVSRMLIDEWNVSEYKVLHTKYACGHEDACHYEQLDSLLKYMAEEEIRKDIPYYDNLILYSNFMAKAIKRPYKVNCEGMNWLAENGFTEADKMRILNGYIGLHRRNSIVILFASCMTEWNDIQASLEQQVSIAGSVVIDMDEDWNTYANLIREIYVDPLGQDAGINGMLEKLKKYPLRLKVLVVEEGQKKILSEYEVLTLKQETDRTNFKGIYVVDSAEEVERIKDVVLSVNNLRHLKMRKQSNRCEELVRTMNVLKTMLDEKGIRRSDVCISGSCSFEIIGIRKAKDVDFFVKSCYREEHGCVTVPWTEKIEYIGQDSVCIPVGKTLSDDLLIEDDNLHFMFNGLKIVNVEIINLKKKVNHREKDIRDNELYNEFMKNQLN